MSVPVWVAEAASRFWEMVGVPPPYPRCLIESATSALSLSVEELPNLDAGVVAHWLRSHGVGGFRSHADRPLHGCLVARDGSGMIFLNTDDPEAERRFSFAHELAHFLRDYWQPRCNAVVRFGEHIIDVLDGRRPPTPSERLAGLLRGCQLKMHVHLMDRDRGRVLATVAETERDADRLAFELLAPATEVMASGRLLRGEFETVLRERYGLSRRGASQYAALLVPEVASDPLLDRITGKRQ